MILLLPLSNIFQLRVKVWPRLMDIDKSDPSDTFPTDEQVKRHPEYNQGFLNY